jgi:hypothetical protein
MDVEPSAVDRRMEPETRANHVGTACLTRGRHPDHATNAQLTAKREDLTTFDQAILLAEDPLASVPGVASLILPRDHRVERVDAGS